MIRHSVTRLLIILRTKDKINRSCIEVNLNCEKNLISIYPSPGSPLCSGFLTLHAKLHLLFVYFFKPSGKSIVAFLFHSFSLLLIILYTYLQKVSLVHLTKLSIFLLLPQANLQRAKSILVTFS